MTIFDRFPNIRYLTWLEIEWLAQGILTDVIRGLDDDLPGLRRLKLDACIAERNRRLAELEPEINAGLYESQLTPEPNEEQRDAMAAAIGKEIANLPLDQRLALSRALYELAALEEGPMDPVLLAELEIRLEEHRANPDAAISHEEAQRRFEKWIEERKRKNNHDS
jgi:hypothetical protein